MVVECERFGKGEGDCSEAEAIELANSTPYGIGSHVFTTDPGQAIRVADERKRGIGVRSVIKY